MVWSINSLRVGDVATRELLTAQPDERVRDVLARLAGKEVGRVPVVSPDGQRRLLGIVRRHDIIHAYIDATKRRRESSY